MVLLFQTSNVGRDVTPKKLPANSVTDVADDGGLAVLPLNPPTDYFVKLHQTNLQKFCTPTCPSKLTTLKLDIKSTHSDSQKVTTMGI